MIDIKQEGDTLWLINNDYVYTSGTPIKRDELPHLISQLIEINRVDRGGEALWDEKAPTIKKI